MTPGHWRWDPGKLDHQNLRPHHMMPIPFTSISRQGTKASDTASHPFMPHGQVASRCYFFLQRCRMSKSMAEMRKNRGRFEICKIQIVTMIQILFAMAFSPSKKPSIDLGMLCLTMVLWLFGGFLISFKRIRSFSRLEKPWFGVQFEWTHNQYITTCPGLPASRVLLCATISFWSLPLIWQPWSTLAYVQFQSHSNASILAENLFHLWSQIILKFSWIHAETFIRMWLLARVWNGIHFYLVTQRFA